MVSRNTRLCPFRKAVDRETNSMTGKMTERERFQPCVGKRCMAYVYVAPIADEVSYHDPSKWGCARIPNASIIDYAWMTSGGRDEAI